MADRTKNSKSVKKTVGSRLRQARQASGKEHSLLELCDLLNEHPLAPDSKKPLLPDTLKQWEYGTNAINIEWIPALCAILDVDTGYLFGEYEEKKHKTADIRAETGLSEGAICRLTHLKRLSDKNRGTIGGEMNEQRIAFYSAFICDLSITGLIESYPGQLIRLRDEGLRGVEEDVFECAEDALEYYNFAAQKVILNFFDRYFEDEILAEIPFYPDSNLKGGHEGG